MGTLDPRTRNTADGTLDPSAVSAAYEASAETRTTESMLSRRRLSREANITGHTIHAASSREAISLDAREYSSVHLITESIHVANSSVSTVSEGREIEMSAATARTSMIYIDESTLRDVEVSRTVIYASIEESSAETAAISRNRSTNSTERRSVN